MSEIVELRGTLRDYAWGSRDFISRYLGRDLEPGTSPGPEAEWWMGAHPAAPSHVRVGARWIPLPDWIAEAPEARLGARSIAAFGAELPFLFKLLAADAPLSLQAHPDAEQAKEGYAREQAAGLALTDPRRNYRDPHPKPELLCALTPFDALVGFRPPGELVEAIERLAVAPLRRLAAPLIEAPDDPRSLRSFFAALWQGDPSSWLGAVVERCASRSESEGDSWVAKLARAHPGDVGALAPLFLNRLHLEPGEAVYLPARQMHCYLGGAAFELMGNSDNVLRGGLTTKHVDPAELLDVLDFGASEPMRIEPEPAADGGSTYPTPASAFEFSRFEIEGECAPSRGGGFEVWLCEEGEGEIESDSSGDRFRLRRGRACAVTALAGDLRIRGQLTLCRASLPQAYACAP